MAQLTQTEINEAKYGVGPEARRAKNIKMPLVASLDEMVKPERPDPTEPARSAGEPTSLTLRQYTGSLKLPGRGVSNHVRPVTEADLEEGLLWGIPRFTRRHPRCTREGMLPLLRTACQGHPFKFLRTDRAFGLFMVERMPWEPLPTVFDVFVVSRGKDGVIGGQRNIDAEVVRIYQAALDWADSINAVEFRFANDVDEDVDLAPFAERLGGHRVTTSYVYDLETMRAERALAAATKTDGRFKSQAEIDAAKAAAQQAE